mmetsp:Transcript_6140/g.8701  ORF Transcript_6140/g.8701 Transcript_6140/m.8701 type:complete len:95 (+) Transcript_6140:1243-1527(+)
MMGTAVLQNVAALFSLSTFDNGGGNSTEAAVTSSTALTEDSKKVLDWLDGNLTRLLDDDETVCENAWTATCSVLIDATNSVAAAKKFIGLYFLD